MAWGRNDQGVTANSTTTKEASNGAPIGTWTLVKKGGGVSGAPGSANAHLGNTSPGSRANVDSNMFGNTTIGAFIPNMAVGVFGVSAKMAEIVDSPLVDAQVRTPGSGYTTNAVVTITAKAGTGGVVNATANSMGRISALNISSIGSGYKGVVNVAIAAPAAQTFNANTSLYNQVTFNGNTGIAGNTIAIAGQPFSVGDALLYNTNSTNNVVTGLSNNATYYVVLANSTVVALANTKGGNQISLNSIAGAASTGQFLTHYNFISIGSSVYQSGDKVTYLVATGNTAISPLVNNTVYFVTGANSTGFYLANSFLYKTGGYINLVPGLSESGHSITGETATGNVTLGGALTTGAVTHAGWVVRREGTGGRAGRVTYETLIAMGSLGAQSASYGTPALVANTSGIANTIFPSNN